MKPITLKVVESLEKGQYVPYCPSSKIALKFTDKSTFNDDDLEMFRNAGYDVEIARFKLEVGKR